MIRDVMVRLEGTASDELRLSAANDIAEEFGSRIIGLYILFLFKVGRWMISFVTSVTVIMLIYHWGIPRLQPWYRVLPGAIMATILWFPFTVIFGWYVTNYATYDMIYGTLGAGIALLVWLYIISIIILVGAEFNALASPRETDFFPS